MQEWLRKASHDALDEIMAMSDEEIKALPNPVPDGLSATLTSMAQAAVDSDGMPKKRFVIENSGENLSNVLSNPESYSCAVKVVSCDTSYVYGSETLSETALKQVTGLL